MLCRATFRDAGLVDFESLITVTPLRSQTSQAVRRPEKLASFCQNNSKSKFSTEAIGLLQGHFENYDHRKN